MWSTPYQHPFCGKRQTRKLMEREVEVLPQVPLSKLAVGSRFWTLGLNPLSCYLALEWWTGALSFQDGVRPGEGPRALGTCLPSCNGSRSSKDTRWSIEGIIISQRPTSPPSSVQGRLFLPATWPCSSPGCGQGCLSASLEETKHQSVLQIAQLKAERAACQVRLQQMTAGHFPQRPAKDHILWDCCGMRALRREKAGVTSGGQQLLNPAWEVGGDQSAWPV